MSKKNSKKIVIRTEASPQIGMGHLMRCLSLAKMLEKDFEISFLLSEDIPKINEVIGVEGFKYNYIGDPNIREDDLYGSSHIVVLDGYGFKAEVQKKIKQKGKALVFIDDLNDQHFYADALINVSDSVSQSEYSAEPNTQFFLGSKYALLRPEFIEAAKKLARRITAVKGIFISMGGADTNNITLKILQSIQTIQSELNIHIILGAVNPHEKELSEHITKQTKNISLHKNIDAKQMVSILSECELAICPASGTSIEAAAVGVGMILGTTANNQLGILNGLIERKCAINAGDLNTASVESLALEIKKCVQHPEMVNAMLSEQKKLIDGLSPQRLDKVFKQLINAN